MRALVVLTLSVALSVGAAGCTASEKSGEERARVLVFLLRGDQLGTAARRVATGETEDALEELASGPTGAERAAGLSTRLPSGIEPTIVSIDDRVATVDLADARHDPDRAHGLPAGGLAQIVFTVTQSQEIDGVRFSSAGDPLHLLGPDDPERVVHRRSDYEEQSPAILVEQPAVGDVVSSPMRLRGTANTFEATFEYEVLAPDGAKLAGTFGTATCGTGCRGTFDEEVTFDPSGIETITLVVFERSARDGSRTKEVEVPLELAPP